MAQTWGLVYTKSEYAYHNITGATEQKFKDVKSFIYILGRYLPTLEEEIKTSKDA